MSRLNIVTQSTAQTVVEGLYRDLERRIVASPPGLCPVDMAASFLKLCHAQTCGKCVPCRVGLGQLGNLLEDVLNGDATLETIDLIERIKKIKVLVMDVDGTLTNSTVYYSRNGEEMKRFYWLRNSLLRSNMHFLSMDALACYR